GRELLSWHGRSNLAVALARPPYQKRRVRRLTDDLRDAGTKQGIARLILPDHAKVWPFQSSARDQCGVLRALRLLDRSDDAKERLKEYQRGLADIFSGGTAQLDTQASAQCLMALVDSSQVPASGEESAYIGLNAGN